MNSLSPAARHELRGITHGKDGPNRRAFEAWAKKYVNTGSPPAPAAPADGAGGGASPAAEGVEPVAPERQALADKLTEHGSDIGAIDALLPDLTKLQARILEMPEGEREAAVLASEERTLRHLYNGSEAALKAGLAEIKKAAETVGLDLTEIDNSGALADLDLHRHALVMARQINRGAAA